MVDQRLDIDRAARAPRQVRRAAFASRPQCRQHERPRSGSRRLTRDPTILVAWSARNILPHEPRKRERRVASLPDESTLLLNTDTRSSVRMEQDRRAVTLESGKTWFKVAKDRVRPFIVVARGVRV